MATVARDLEDKACLDPQQIRLDFPLLQDAPLAQGLHYLDNAATTHKPQLVIDAVSDCYSACYGPIHRGLYPLAEEATQSYEQARARLARFLGAAAADEVIFTRSTTEGINMVAWGWARERLRPGDRVWVSRMEHHANYLPWQRVCRDRGAELRIIELNRDGSLDLAGAPGLFAPQTRMIALSQVSNVLGVDTPLRELCASARALGIPVLVDAAQGVSHLAIDVAELGCDFLACSAHKMYGPAGIGLLYGRAARLAEMQPLLVGGGMVDEVGEGIAESSWTQLPARFEAGSPNLPAALGFAAAADYLERLGLERVHAHVASLTTLAAAALAELPGVRLWPPAGIQRSAILSFTLEGVHPHDVAQVAGEQGVAIRAGHHCAQPLMRRLGLVATARASFGIYNGPGDVNALVRAVDNARRLLA